MRAISIRTHLALALGLTLALASGTARADAGQGAIRLSSDITVLGVQHFPDVETFFQFGVWPGSGASGLIPSLGVGFAYQVTDAILIGGRAGFGVIVIDSPAPLVDDFTIGAFSLVPFFEYLFMSGNIRPFVGAQAGFQAYFPSNGDAEAFFVGGGLGGVHIFAEPGFSISPTGFFNFLYYGPADRAGFELVVALSFEGWIN